MSGKIGKADVNEEKKNKGAKIEGYLKKIEGKYILKKRSS